MKLSHRNDSGFFWRRNLRALASSCNGLRYSSVTEFSATIPGGMGVVRKAIDLRLVRTVALKFLPAEVSVEQKEKKSLAREAKAASALDHANIGSNRNRLGIFILQSTLAHVLQRFPPGLTAVSRFLRRFPWRLALCIAPYSSICRSFRGSAAPGNGCTRREPPVYAEYNDESRCRHFAGRFGIRPIPCGRIRIFASHRKQTMVIQINRKLSGPCVVA